MFPGVSLSRNRPSVCRVVYLPAVHVIYTYVHRESVGPVEFALARSAPAALAAIVDAIPRTGAIVEVAYPLSALVACFFPWKCYLRDDDFDFAAQYG